MPRGIAGAGVATINYRTRCQAVIRVGRELAPVVRDPAPACRRDARVSATFGAEAASKGAPGSRRDALARSQRPA